MTLIELLVFVAEVALGVLLAKTLYSNAGLWGAVCGFLAGVAVIPSIIFVYLKYRRFAYPGHERMPVCTCGGSLRYEKVGKERHLLCQQCKTRYERRRAEVWVFEDGVRRPYKRMVKWQGWI